MTPEEIRKLSYLKAVKLEQLIEQVEERIDKASSALTKTILKEFLQKLTIEQGKVIAQFNRRTLTLFNQAWKIYQNEVRAKLIDSIVTDIDTILDENDTYYRKTSANYNLERSEMKRLLDRRLGIRDNGTLIREGYMNGLLDDSNIRAEIQKFVYKEMLRSSGFESFKKGMKTFIEGDKGKFGLFQKHYKTFSYDAYSVIDRYTGAQFAQKLGYNHFIYQGGLIKTSRPFCVKRNGNIYTTEEAEEWQHDEDLEAIESRERYNWLLDMGGYNCRHFQGWIAPEIAQALRPELKDE